MKTTLKFLGATRTVTGSKYLIEHGERRILVDCGLFQGYKKLRLRNWEPFPIPPESIDAIVLSHAHIDHSGYIPLMVKNGFTGPVYATEATRDLCHILLPDSGHIQEEDAARANRYGYTKHKPAVPLYTEAEAHAALGQFKVLDLGTSHEMAKDLSLQLHHAGHILGASMLHFRTPSFSLLFTGDLGRQNEEVMKDPAIMQEADYLVLDSTYGNRLHPKENPKEELRDVIVRTLGRGGTVLIPSFAVGRAQLLLYYLYQLREAGEIPGVPVYLDSPMAQNATDLFLKHNSEHRLSKDLAARVCGMAQYVRTIQDSKALHASHYPSIIISASGMAEGGRVLHHLKHYAPKQENAVVFAGYQAGGTRGDRMVRGEREIKIHGDLIPIRAKVENLASLSSHADYEETLTWLGNFRSPPRKLFLTHGESAAIDALKLRVEEQLGWSVTVPEYQEGVEL